MNKEDLQGLLCAEYCSFYKPGKDEELACMGFSVIRKLIEKGMEVPTRAENTDVEGKTEDGLFLVICRRCPFFGEDCDFAVWKRGGSTHVDREAVNPCGGFLCLGHCLDQDTMDIEDINLVI